MLEAAIPEGRYHEDSGRDKCAHHQRGDDVRGAVGRRKIQERGHRSRRRWCRKPYEEPTVDASRLHIEPGQPGGGAQEVENGNQPADAAIALQPPDVGKYRRDGAKCENVGERVEFAAKGALGPGQARNPTVEGIENAGDENEDRGGLEVTAQSEHKGIETEQHVAEGKKTRQQVDALAGSGSAVSGLHSGIFSFRAMTVAPS